MPAYTTPFGLLTLEPNDGVLTSGRLRAELRGLELLNGIVSTAKSWSRKCSTDSWNTLLVTGMDGFELRIDVLKTVESYLLRNDPHIVVELYRGRNRSVGTVERVCILYNQSHPGCAIADAVVSLVLLGESNWPEGSTPNTLREFSEAAQLDRMARRLKLGLIDLTLEDREEIADVRKALELGMPIAAVDMLCCFARRCYTCKGLEIEDIKRYTNPLFAEIPKKAIEAYAMRPSTPTDVLFLPDFA